MCFWSDEPVGNRVDHFNEERITLPCNTFRPAERLSSDRSLMLHRSLRLPLIWLSFAFRSDWKWCWSNWLTRTLIASCLIAAGDGQAWIVGENIDTHSSVCRNFRHLIRQCLHFFGRSKFCLPLPEPNGSRYLKRTILNGTQKSNKNTKF